MRFRYHGVLIISIKIFMTNLRPYQQKALDEIRKHYASGEKKVLLHLATGGGKTVIFSEVLKGVVSKGKKAIMVVRGKNLIDQTSQRLFRENVPHGCYQGNHWNYQPNASIQICSVDTLYRRKVVPPADLVVIDECHLANSPSFRWVIDQCKNAFFLPVSATPHHPKGMLHIANKVVYPIAIKELMAQGYLSKPRYFIPTKIDLSKVSIDRSTSDYNVAETAALLEGATVYGDILASYKKLCYGKSAVIFAINIEHSLMIRDMFINEGIPARHVEADTSDGERAQAIKDLESGAIKILTNVGILTTGVDIPFLEVVILARPTMSYNLFIQMCGRGTRVTPTKSEFIILDHTNNITEHGFIEDERPCNLEPIEKKKKKNEERVVTCMNCYATIPYTPDMSDICPHCEQSIKVTKEKVAKALAEHVEAELREIQAGDNWSRVLVKINRTIVKGHKIGYVWHFMNDKFGELYAKENWPRVKKEFRSRNYPPQPVAGPDSSSTFNG
jgi:superfamily II DNA or RNA helicase